MTETPTTGEAGHRHDRHCYWDHIRCGWVCGPRLADPAPVHELAEPAEAPPRWEVGAGGVHAF